MIIDSSNRISTTLLPTSPARTNKTPAPASAEASAADTDVDQTRVAQQNAASAVTPLQDADAARAAIQSIRKNFLAQPEVAMLAQANQLPQNALRLLQ